MIKHATMDMHPDTLTDTEMGDVFEDPRYRVPVFNTEDRRVGATSRDAIHLMIFKSPWNRSSRSSGRTSSTGSAGPPAKCPSSDHRTNRAT